MPSTTTYSKSTFCYDDTAAEDDAQRQVDVYVPNELGNDSSPEIDLLVSMFSRYLERKD